MTAVPAGIAAETPQEEIGNALHILVNCVVALPTGLRNMTEEEYQAVLARLFRAKAKIESEARK